MVENVFDDEDDDADVDDGCCGVFLFVIVAAVDFGVDDVGDFGTNVIARRPSLGTGDGDGLNEEDDIFGVDE